jgi:hypothetical protein
MAEQKDNQKDEQLKNLINIISLLYPVCLKNFEKLEQCLILIKIFNAVNIPPFTIKGEKGVFHIANYDEYIEPALNKEPKDYDALFNNENVNKVMFLVQFKDLEFLQLAVAYLVHTKNKGKEIATYIIKSDYSHFTNAGLSIALNILDKLL